MKLATVSSPKCFGCPFLAFDNRTSSKLYIPESCTSPSTSQTQLKIITFSIKYTRDNQSKNHTVALDSTLDPIHNSLDPVKMLLTLTLRTGTVHTTSIDQLIADTLAGPDRTVQWIHPDRPLHPQFQGAGSSVKHSQPAGTQQFNRILQVVAETANIKVDLVPHDIRCGAARDASRLPPTGTQGIEGARTLSAHSYGTMFSGVTEEYVGPSSTPTWEQRHLVEPEEDFDLLTDADMELPHLRRKRNSLDPLPLPGQGPKRKVTTRSTMLLDAPRRHRRELGPCHDQRLSHGRRSASG